MTIQGKCDMCRERKVKCDEGRPTCSACAKKGRPCRYLTAAKLQRANGEEFDDSFEINETSFHLEDNSVNKSELSLRRSWQASHGRGAYAVYKHTPSRSERCPLKGVNPDAEIIILSPRHSCRSISTCSQEAMAAKWSALFGPEALSLNPLGDWVHVVFALHGTHSFLDDTSDYAYSSMLAFREHVHPSPKSLYVARGRALKSLRTSLDSAREEDRFYIMLAMMLFYAAEHFLELGQRSYVPHLWSIANMVTTATNIPDEHARVVQNIISLTYVDEVMESLRRGLPARLPSHFDPQTLLFEEDNIDIALAATESLLLEIPSLAAAVRSVTLLDSPDFITPEPHQVALSLAQIYHCDRDAYIRRTLAHHTTQHPSPLTFPIPPRFPTSLSFSSLPAYVLATRFYHYEVLLCGLIQQFHSQIHTPPEPFPPRRPLQLPPSLSLRDVRARDLQAATNLVRSFPYAVRPGSAQAMVALAALTPIELAVGAWLRARSRAGEGDEEGDVDGEGVWGEEHAGEMVEWCMSAINYIFALWNSHPRTVETIEELCEWCAGGRLLG